MKNTDTIPQKVAEAFANYEKGTEFKRKDIIKIVMDCCECNLSSIIPSDYCYNRCNDDIKTNFENRIHIFEYIARNRYKYLGLNSPYTGSVFHKPKGGNEYKAGDMVNGKLKALLDIK